MSNGGYILAAYAITLGALVLYGLHLWNRLRTIEHTLAPLTSPEERQHGRR
jgi:hypothetical protein